MFQCVWPWNGKTHQFLLRRKGPRPSADLAGQIAACDDKQWWKCLAFQEDNAGDFLRLIMDWTMLKSKRLFGMLLNLPPIFDLVNPYFWLLLTIPFFRNDDFGPAAWRNRRASSNCQAHTKCLIAAAACPLQKTDIVLIHLMSDHPNWYDHYMTII